MSSSVPPVTRSCISRRTSSMCSSAFWRMPSGTPRRRTSISSSPSAPGPMGPLILAPPGLALEVFLEAFELFGAHLFELHHGVRRALERPDDLVELELHGEVVMD